MISKREQMRYGIGAGGYCASDAVVVGFLTLFCTDVVLLEPGVVAIFLMIPKLCDIITDFVFMHFVEKTKTRFGTYRPWLLSAIPMGICLIFLFMNPSFLTTQTQKLIWVLVFYFLLLSIFETLYWCPYTALGGVISPNEKDRSGLMAYRSAFEPVFTLIISMTMLPLLSHFGNDYRDVTGWRYATVIYASIGAAAALICFFGVKERISVDNKQTNRQSLSMKEELKLLAGSKPFLRLTAITMLYYLYSYAYYAIFSYYCIYNLGHEEWYTIASGVSTVASTAFAMMAPKISEKIGRKKSILLAAVLAIVAAVIFAFANSLAALLAFVTVKDMGSLLMYVVAYSALPGVADRLVESSGADAEGFIYGVFSSWGKLAISVGGFLGAILLAIGQYDATMEVQSSYTMGWIRYGMVGIILICSALVILLVLSDSEKETSNS